MLSVTVPGHIQMDEQIKLAQALEHLGVHLIQTEGTAISKVLANQAVVIEKPMFLLSTL